MTDLLQAKCSACQKGAPQVSREAAQQLLKQIPQWSIEEREGVPQLERSYSFGNFVKALEFTNKIGAIAEAEGHHPGLLTEWGKVTVTWWTHKIKGLHENDFIMAAKSDKIYSS